MAVLKTGGKPTSKGLYQPAKTIATNHSITNCNNALKAGPITINNRGYSTLPTGSTLNIGKEIKDANVTSATIAEDAVTEAKLAYAINKVIATYTAKTYNATHTGVGTGATELCISSGVAEIGTMEYDVLRRDKISHSIK